MPGLGGVGELGVAADLRGLALDTAYGHYLGKARDAPKESLDAG